MFFYKIFNPLILCFGIIILFGKEIKSQNNPYIIEGSIGNSEQISTKCSMSSPSFTFIPFQCWIGERVIFLPKSKALQTYGYQMFSSGSWPNNKVSYQDVVGKIGTIQKIEKKGYSTEITVKTNDGSTYYSRLLNVSEKKGEASIDGIAFLRDIDDARKLYLNKTLWLSNRQIVSYDSENDSFIGKDVKKYSPVKVVDIVAGWYESNPVRFIIQNEFGIKGFVDVNMSGTNVAAILRNSNRFEELFFEQDPRQLYPWNKEIWSSIESSQVFLGMTKLQVLMALGKPHKINQTMNQSVTIEQWVYKNKGYLYFQDSLLTSIQN